MGENISNTVTTDTENRSEVSTTEINKVENVIAAVKCVYEPMPKYIAYLARVSDQKTVEKEAGRVLNTIAAMNATDEYAVGIHVDGVLYRFNEYEGTPGLDELLVPGRVVLNDVVSARNKAANNRFTYNPSDLLNPGQFILAVKKICTCLRINPTLNKLTKPEVGLLADINKYAVYSRKVEDRLQPRITFIQGEYDAEKATSIDEWMNKRVTTLFS